MKPVLRVGPLSGSVMVITRYTIRGGILRAQITLSGLTIDVYRRHYRVPSEGTATAAIAAHREAVKATARELGIGEDEVARVVAAG